MRQIFKNYLATFVKHWLQTIGTVLFILMMVAIVVGMLAAPLQINTKENKMYDKDNKYSQEIDPLATYNPDFIDEYFNKGNDYKFDDVTINKSGKLLSDAVSNVVKNENSHGIELLSQDLNKYSWGSNFKSRVSILLTREDYEKGKTNGAWGDLRKNIDAYFDSVLKDHGIDGVIDIKKFIKDPQTTSKYWVRRFAAQIYMMLSTNNFPIKIQTIEDKLNGKLDGITSAGDFVTKLMYENMVERKVNKHGQRFYFMYFQLLNPGTISEELRETYNFDINQYIASRALWDSNRNNYKAKYSADTQLYYSVKDTSSVFPSLGVQLGNANNSNSFNQIQLEEGRLPKSIKELAKEEGLSDDIETITSNMNSILKPEVVVNSSFAKDNSVKIGDYFTLPEQTSNTVAKLISKNAEKVDDVLTGAIKFKIVGIGQKFRDIVPGKHFTKYLQETKNYAFAYTDNDLFQQISEANWYYAVTAELNESVIKIGKPSSKAEPWQLFDQEDANAQNYKGVFANGKKPFINFSETKGMKSIQMVKVQVIIYSILGAAVLILAFIFINFIITKELNETRRQIGIFKSFGYKISQLSFIFAVKTWITILLGILIGFACSIPLQQYSAKGFADTVMFSFSSIYVSAWFLCVLFIVIPLLFMGASYVLTLIYLREPTLSLLNNGAKIKNKKIHLSPFIKHLTKTGKGFGYRLQQSFVKSNKGKFVAVQILFALASLTFTLMFGAQTLMYSIINQSLAPINRKTDHNYYMWGLNGVHSGSINEDGTTKKYTVNGLNNNYNFEFKKYDGNQKFGEVISKSDDSTDSRYKVAFLINSITNEFSKDKENAFNLLLPKDYYYGMYGIEDFNNSDDSWLKNAGKDKDKLMSNPIMYSDYYMNWILTSEINKVSEDSIKDVKTNANDKINIDSLGLVERLKTEEVVNNSKDDSVKNRMNETLFGMNPSVTVNDQNGKVKILRNNIYLSDVTKILSLELAEGYAKNIITQNIKSATPSKEEIDKAILSAEQDPVLKDYNPNDPKYWGILNNPLIDFGQMINGGSNGMGNVGVSLTKLSPKSVDIIMGASMLGINSKDINDMPVITFNQQFINMKEDSPSLTINLRNIDDTQAVASWVSLNDFSSSQGIDNFNLNNNHLGVSDSTLARLAEPAGEPLTVNAVIPYGLAKNRNLKTGETINALSDSGSPMPVKLKIIGINKSYTLSGGTGWPIYVDYNQFLNTFFEENSIKNLKDQPLYNQMLSRSPLFEGNIDITNIAASLNSIKYVASNMSLNMNSTTSVFGSIFNGMIDVQSMTDFKVDDKFTIMTNPNIASTSSEFLTTIPYNIVRLGIDNAMSQINNILVLFICLVAVLLLIILVVVMNIVVEEATPIILTLKSLGYKQREINWITMGSYVTGAVVSFVIAYLLSLVIWNVVLAIVGNLWHIYAFMSYGWQAPVITFLVIGAILFIGWFSSDRQVEKIPLNSITGFN